MLRLTVCAVLMTVTWAATSERVPDFAVSDAELQTLVGTLREQDANRARPNQIGLDYQGHTTTQNDADNARNSLFQHVDTSVLRKPTYEKFIALTDNYDKYTGNAEDETNAEKNEITSFLDAVLESTIWRKLYEFLHDKNHPYASDTATFRKWIAQLWFVRYSRAKGRLDTSGFEHIFMGEIKNNEISGMHNWVRFYLLEKDSSQRFDYKGFLVQRFNVMAAVKFSWGSEYKRSGSFLIGTSPEFDMALYTLCFLSRRGRSTCNIEINGCPMAITSHDLIQQGKLSKPTVKMADQAELPKITREELEKHCTADSLWIVFGGKVYDVTKFLEDHPGGNDILMEHGGKDATEDFEDVGHSSDARVLRDGYLVGILAD
uniref:Endoribonuclease n=2 Tax=Plectus sambesii TaxID=2011161 RepID=A0A914WLP4_9BILA